MGFIREDQPKSHDPKGINSHLKVQFEDVIAEPDGQHSFNFVWQASGCCYKFCFSLCYGVHVAFSHLCLSAYWGLQFGLISYVHVWYVTPIYKLCGYIMHVPATCFRLCMRCIMDPWFEASAYMFMMFESPPEGDIGDWQPMSMY